MKLHTRLYNSLLRLAPAGSALSANVAETPDLSEINIEGVRGSYDDGLDGKVDRGVGESNAASVLGEREDSHPARGRRAKRRAR